jgi:hypothetical protein
MRKVFAIAAAAAIIGLVTPAAAQSINVRVGDGYHQRHGYHGYRARPKVVVVKKHRHWDRGYHRGWRNANRPAVVIAR